MTGEILAVLLQQVKSMRHGMCGVSRIAEYWNKIISFHCKKMCFGTS